MVLPICCGGTSGGGCWGSGVSSPPSDDFMPSLKPFTAPPRSCPMLRSFLVPKIITTTKRTISQCQMLNPPMGLSLVRVPAHDHRSERLGSADDVQVDV